MRLILSKITRFHSNFLLLLLVFRLQTNICFKFDCYRSYFCKGDKSKNLLPDIQACGMSDHIERALRYTASHARSLLMDVDSNSCEQFNSIVNKFLGGKYCSIKIKYENT